MKYRFILENLPKSEVIRRPSRTAAQGDYLKTEIRLLGFCSKEGKDEGEGLKLSKGSALIFTLQFIFPIISFFFLIILILLFGCLES